jgi:alpha-mannosidase
VVERLLAFELRRDAGDLYTPAVREPLDRIRFTACDLVHRGPLRGELALLHVDTHAPGQLLVRLQLDAGRAVLRLEIEGSNSVEDARLRLRIATTAGAGSATIADAAFLPVARVSLVVGDADAAMEHVTPTAPLHRYVSRYAADRGTTVVSDGLAEYESLDDGGVAVTLLRAVGALSRHDLPERPGHAGWPAETPGAQSAGPFGARLAVALHGPDSPSHRDAIERLVDDILVPVTGDTLRSNLGSERVAGGLELEGDGLAFSAAMPARRAGWITLRCVNRRPHAVPGRWRLGVVIAEATLARLDETPGEALRVHGGSTIEFTAPAMTIVTVLARLEPDGVAGTVGR